MTNKGSPLYIKTVFFGCRIDENLHKRLKSLLASEGVSFQDWVERKAFEELKEK